MTTKVQLTTTTAEFQKLHELADSRKAVVKVDRELLSKLLLDHGRVLNALSSSSTFNIQEPVQLRHRQTRKP